MTQAQLRTALKAQLDIDNHLGVYSKDSKEPSEPAIRVGEPHPSWYVETGLECVIDPFPQLVPIGVTYDGAYIQEVFRVYLVQHNTGDLLGAVRRIVNYFQTVTATTVNSRNRVIDVPYYILEIRNPD